MITATTVSSTSDWVDALAGLPTASALPRRLVIVPSSAAAAGLRLRIIERRRLELLAGTEITTVAELITEGGSPPPMSPAVRRVAVRHLAREVELEHLDRREIETGGLDAAVAAAIAEIEAADLVAEMLLESVNPLVRDLARLWQRLGTCDRRFDDAIEALASRPGVDASLAVVTGLESTGEARVIAALPRLTLAVAGGDRDRIGALFGEAAAAAVIEPELSADLDLEVYASIAGERDAAVDWVCQQLIDGGLPVDDIALIIGPSDRRWARRLGAALARLPWCGPAPVRIAGGAPLAETAEGARLLGWLRDRASAADPESLMAAALRAVPMDPDLERRLRCGARELAVLGLEGYDAVAAVIEVVEATRGLESPVGPALLIGTADQLVGVERAAVRIIGLGTRPASPQVDLLGAAHIDAVGLRRPDTWRRARDRAIAAAVSGAERAALSATGAPSESALVARLERRFDRPLDRWAEATPLTESMWLRRAAAGRITAPRSWRRDDAFDPMAIRATSRSGGELGVDPPGLDPDRPIAATDPETLADCPRRFLFDRMLGWGDRAPAGEPAALPTSAGPLHVIGDPDESQLDAAATQLATRQLPGTRASESCRRCPFDPACAGEGAR